MGDCRIHFIKKNIAIYCIYFIIIFLFSIYSYTLVDLNLTLFNHKLWDNFRSFIIQIGYFNRGLSTAIYFSGIIILFLLYYLVKKVKPNPLKLAITIGLVSLVAYPFLSHDFFNYMFYGKIITFYGQNPYVVKAVDFPADQWTRFMHWTHNTYPYGPTFLPLTLIPSLLSGGKFILSLFFFKLTFVSFYLGAVWVVSKIDRNKSLIIATHPLIIIEGLITPHNDLIAMSLGLIGIYLIFNNKNNWSRFLFLVSGLIKYTTLPILILSKKNIVLNTLAFIGVLSLLGYLTIFGEIQPWYFLNLFIFVPIFPEIFKKIDIFLLGLLSSYYPYIMLGGWDKQYKVDLKHQIIFYFFIANLLVLCIYQAFNFFKKRSSFNLINS